MNPDQQQVLALAAVFQAAHLADKLAATGDCDMPAMDALMKGVMALDADDFKGIYPEPQYLRDGLMLIDASLNRTINGEQMRAMNYGLALLHLTARLKKNNDVNGVLRHRLQALKGQQAHFDAFTDPAFCHRVASIYVDTLGSFKFRIQVQGKPEHLQNDDTAARIRALFLAGVRGAFLWQQLGGRRWQLLFHRKRLVATVNSLKSVI